MSKICNYDIQNLSKALCSEDYGQIRALWFDQNSTGVTFANAILAATWAGKIYAIPENKMFILNPTKNFQIVPTNAEPTFREYNNGRRVKVREGYLDLLCTYEKLSTAEMNKLQSLDGAELYAYTITENGYIMGEKSATNLKPVLVEIFVSDPIPAPDNSNLWSINVYVRYLKASLGKFGIALEPTAFEPTELTGIINVTLTAVSADVSSDVFIFTAASAEDGVPISDISTAGDIEVFLVSTDVALTCDALSNVGNVYTAKFDAGTPLTEFPYAVRLKSPATATQKKYETPADSNAITPAA